MKDNINGEIAHLRDTFLEAESEYVNELLKDEKFASLIGDSNGNYNSESLFKAAQSLVEGVENGQIRDEDMDHVEKCLVVLLASIQDKTLEHKLIIMPQRKAR